MRAVGALERHECLRAEIVKCKCLRCSRRAEDFFAQKITADPWHTVGRIELIADAKFCTKQFGEAAREARELIHKRVAFEHVKRLTALQGIDHADLVAIDRCAALRKFLTRKALCDRLGRGGHDAIADTACIYTLCGKRFAECDADAAGVATREFFEIAIAFVRENRAPRSVAPHRNQRMTSLARDQFEAALQRAKRAGAGELTFGKEADHFAFFQSLDHFTDCFEWLFAADVDRAKNACEPTDHGACDEGFVHHKADRARACGGEKKRVGIGHMIWQQQDAATCGDAFCMHGTHAIDEADADEKNHADRANHQREGHMPPPGRFRASRIVFHPH